MNYGSILLSFGLIYPPLAIMMCVSTLLYLSQTILALSHEANGLLRMQSSDEIKHILLLLSELKVKDGVSLIKFGLCAISMPLFGIFAGAFLFDVYGDYGGWRISMPFLTAFPVLVAVTSIAEYFFPVKKTSELNSKAKGVKVVAVKPTNDMESIVPGANAEQVDKQSTTTRTSNTRGTQITIIALRSRITDEKLTQQLQLEETYEEVAAEMVGFLAQVAGLVAS